MKLVFKISCFFIIAVLFLYTLRSLAIYYHIAFLNMILEYPSTILGGSTCVTLLYFIEERKEEKDNKINYSKGCQK
ncbi:hypothetical protein ABH521_008665 [Staphylococcus warneri]|uniref:hypothetical protein n=1 Tax=Staphylococcus warneri TaxID=1292 RepID=UPI0032614884